MSLSRPTAPNMPRILKPLALATALSATLMAALFIPAGASAAPGPPEPVVKAPKAAPAGVSAELAVCPGQTFMQPFTELKDSNYYTLVEGSESAATGEGWELLKGAQVVEGTRPDGSSGGIFDLPAGAVAISPPTCVTLLYPTARAWIQAVAGGGGVQVFVSYGSIATSKQVGSLTPKPGGNWELSGSFNVQPQLGGNAEGVREVRFVYANTTKNSEYHVGGLYVDPRLSH